MLCLWLEMLASIQRSSRPGSPTKERAYLFCPLTGGTSGGSASPQRRFRSTRGLHTANCITQLCVRSQSAGTHSVSTNKLCDTPGPLELGLSSILFLQAPPLLVWPKSIPLPSSSIVRRCTFNYPQLRAEIARERR